MSPFFRVSGLATYGYNITRAMGTQMVCLTPSRGFAAELATAFVILVCSQWGLPNSSSQVRLPLSSLISISRCRHLCKPGLNLSPHLMAPPFRPPSLIVHRWRHCGRGLPGGPVRCELEILRHHVCKLDDDAGDYGGRDCTCIRPGCVRTLSD